MSGAAPNVRPDRGFTPEDLEAQRAARDAVMKIPPFPELQTRLTRVLGPGAERDMLHQLVYWFSKPKMQSRWWAYKTFQEWRDERGLNRKQVDKARARLRPRGVLEEKYGPHKRIHYRLDWVRLAELLLIPLKGVQSVIDPPLGDAGVTDPLKRYSPTQENTQESISRENKQDNPLLQSGGNPLTRNPRRAPKMKK
jgi:hypothetical protein